MGSNPDPTGLYDTNLYFVYVWHKYIPDFSMLKKLPTFCIDKTIINVGNTATNM